MEAPPRRSGDGPRPYKKIALSSRLFLATPEGVRDADAQSQTALPRIGKVRSQKAQLHAAGPVRTDDVIGSASEHPGERSIRSGHIRKSRLRNCGVQVRKTKLHLAEGMQSVLVNLPAAEENARPKQVILQMRLGRDRAGGSELEGADAGVVPGGVVIRGNHHFVGEVPAGTEIEAVRAKVAGYV